MFGTNILKLLGVELVKYDQVVLTKRECSSKFLLSAIPKIPSKRLMSSKPPKPLKSTKYNKMPQRPPTPVKKSKFRQLLKPSKPPKPLQSLKGYKMPQRPQNTPTKEIKFCQQALKMEPYDFIVRPSGRSHKDEGTHRKWKNMFCCVLFPMILLLGYEIQVEHSRHPQERPPFVKLEYMRIRTKNFPWDGGSTKTFFHNPRINALPEGYEDGNNNTLNVNVEEEDKTNEDGNYNTPNVNAEEEDDANGETEE